MAEMAGTFGAQDLGADHAVAVVGLLIDMALLRGLRKARPAAAGIEFGVGLEQHLAAAGADIAARALLMLILAGERPFGRLFAQHRILHRCQLAPPFLLALGDLVGRRLAVGHGFSFELQAASPSSPRKRQSRPSLEALAIASVDG